jgi:hypothetical protein
MANILERLTEGTVFNDKKKESAALVSKWEKSGLLEGISEDFKKSSMAVLLENQAKELLREANAMSAGDVQGFASVAFPIVRRVFAGLIANDLVSVQPMSLPSGLVFFMDFKYGKDLGDSLDPARKAGESLYGDRVGQDIRKGVRVNGNEFAEKGYYALGSGYGAARVNENVLSADFKVWAAGTVANYATTSSLGAKVRFDPDVLSEATDKVVQVFRYDISKLTAYGDLIAEQDMFSTVLVSGSTTDGSVAKAESWVPWTQTISNGSALTASIGTQVRRLTRIVQGATGAANDLTTKKYLELVFVAPSGTTACTSDMDDRTGTSLVIQYPIKDKLNAPDSANALGAIAGVQPWALEQAEIVPEIQLKVDSFSITARARKLKAAWTPELGQDLNAYHNLDAEVELTSMLSEQIGLEIDQEILNDLIKGQTGGVKYWSRRPGNFVNRLTGQPFATDLTTAALPPDFTGNVSMWYETLLETINDVSADIHRKTLRGGANFIVVSPEVANILEFTAGFRATVTHDSDKGSTGAVKVGALNSKFDVIVDPYFPRNVVLVGRKGASFLESGYVYAPYVPLQTTPTIFDPKDFTPRKAVMTRYGKAFVRPDMYGLVIVQDLLG